MTPPEIELLLNAAHLLDDLGEEGLASQVRTACEEHSEEEDQ